MQLSSNATTQGCLGQGSVSVRKAFHAEARRRLSMTYEPHATFIQRHNSGIVGRLPYERMPTRKIFAVAQKNPATVAMETRMLSAICDIGRPATRNPRHIPHGSDTKA